MQIVEDEPGTSQFVRLLRRPNSAFTLAELVVVVLVIGILAAVSLPKVFDQSTASELTTIRLSLQTIQDQIELRHAVTGKYPSTIDKKWFRGNRLPHHPLNGGAVPDLHVFSGDARQHPSYKTLDQYGAYWYNPAVGIVRARVPALRTSAETLALYNLVNQAALTKLDQKYD